MPYASLFAWQSIHRGQVLVPSQRGWPVAAYTSLPNECKPACMCSPLSTSCAAATGKKLAQQAASAQAAGWILFLLAPETSRQCQLCMHALHSSGGFESLILDHHKPKV